MLDVFSEYGKKELEKMYASNQKAELTGEVTMKVPHVCVYILYRYSNRLIYDHYLLTGYNTFCTSISI